MPELVGFQTMVILNHYVMSFDAVVIRLSAGGSRRSSAVYSGVLSATLLPFDEFSLVGFSVL